MSSILDALRKLEEAETRPSGERRPHEPRRLTFVLVGAGIVAAFVAGVGATLWLRTGPAPKPIQTAAVTPATLPETVPAPAPRPAPPPPAAVAAPVPAAAPPEPPPAAAPAPAPAPVALAPVPPAPAPPRAMIEAEPPRAHLTDIPPPPPAREPIAATPPAPAVNAPLARRPEPAVEAPPPRIPEPAAEPPPAQPVEDVVSTRPPAGAPQVAVNFLVYSRAADRRTVTLTIGDAGMVTLHEGEAAANVEVVRILADRVHVRHGGQLYAVKAVP